VGLRERAEAIDWYHCLELAPGLVTDGVFDLRDQVHHYGLPDRLDGKRALDIGSLNGFWAFEMERRGASEVVSLDVEDPARLDRPVRREPETEATLGKGGLAPGREGFELAKEAFGSQVLRVDRSVYEAAPEELGTFDVVFCGSVLIHLRDQLLALERIAALCTDLFISAEQYDRMTGLLPFPAARYLADRKKAVVFWLPSARTWRRMIWSAGFDRVSEHRRFRLHSTRGWKVRHVVHHAHRRA
jgi:tRNA (mo5U34)-methyltransferase